MIEDIALLVSFGFFAGIWFERVRARPAHRPRILSARDRK